MPSFKDKDGLEWTLALSAPLILEIRQSFDPYFMLEAKGRVHTYDRVSADPALLCGVIYVLCGAQREKREVTQQQFYEEVIAGDAIAGAIDALLEAMLLFTPRQPREVLKAVAEKQNQFQDKALDRIRLALDRPDLEAAVLDKIDATIAETMAKVMTQPSNASSLPASVE